MANAFSELPSKVKFYFRVLKDDDHEKKKRKRKEKGKRTSVYTADKFQLATCMLALLYCAHALVLQSNVYSIQQTCAKRNHLVSAFNGAFPLSLSLFKSGKYKVVMTPLC